MPGGRPRPEPILARGIQEPMELTGLDLLFGAVYALEQAGCLLHDAFSLFLKGRYSSSVVLAVFSKEEMGRFVRTAEKKRQGTTQPTMSFNRFRNGADFTAFGGDSRLWQLPLTVIWRQKVFYVIRM